MARDRLPSIACKKTKNLQRKNPRAVLPARGRLTVDCNPIRYESDMSPAEVYLHPTASHWCYSQLKLRTDTVIAWKQNNRLLLYPLNVQESGRFIKPNKKISAIF